MRRPLLTVLTAIAVLALVALGVLTYLLLPFVTLFLHLAHLFGR